LLRQREAILVTPQPGWTEQNPSDWVEASLSALSNVQQLDGHRVLALGLSGQMHMVPLNAEGRVIRPAILWNDQRTGKAVDAIEATVSSGVDPAHWKSYEYRVSTPKVSMVTN